MRGDGARWAALIGLAAALGGGGCGPAEQPAETPAQAATVSGDLAEVAVYVVKDTDGNWPYYAGDPFAAFRQELARARYRLVDASDQADLIVRVDATEAPARLKLLAERYTITLTLRVVDKHNNSQTVELLRGAYTNDDEAADEREVARMVARLSSSPRVAGFAAWLKGARAAWATAGQAPAAGAQRPTDAGSAEEQKKAAAAAQALTEERAARALREEIEKAIKAGQAPKAESLDALKLRIDALRELSPDMARFLAHRNTSYTLEAAWLTLGAGAPERVAGALGGTLIKSGEATGKELAIPWSGKAGHCYAVVSRLTTEGADEMEYVRWKAAAGNTYLQRWSAEREDMGSLLQQSIPGACLTKDTSVALSDEISAPGTKRALRYAVVGFPKAKLPLYLAAYMTSYVTDHCDAKAWYERWADPIPGSLVYRGSEPFLITTAREGSERVGLNDASLGSPDATKGELSAAPPVKVSFTTKFSLDSCGSDAESPASIKLMSCERRIVAKYMPQMLALEQAKKAATTEAALADAKERDAKVSGAAIEERDRVCRPERALAVKEMEAAFDKIVDLYADSPRKSPIDRAEELKILERGSKER